MAGPLPSRTFSEFTPIIPTVSYWSELTHAHGHTHLQRRLFWAATCLAKSQGSIV